MDDFITSDVRQIEKERAARYIGKTAADFVHLEDISYYCHNYYKGYDGDILYAESDDDNYTAWYFCDKDDIKNEAKHLQFGESFTSSGDIIEEIM